MTKDALLAELARSRAAISRDYTSVREEMDVVAKAKRVVRRNPFAWLSGAAALGWFLAGPKTRTVVKPARGTAKRGTPEESLPKARFGILALLLAMFKLAAPFLRPVATTYATRLLAEWAARMGK